MIAETRIELSSELTGSFFSIISFLNSNEPLYRTLLSKILASKYDLCELGKFLERGGHLTSDEVRFAKPPIAPSSPGLCLGRHAHEAFSDGILNELGGGVQIKLTHDAKLVEFHGFHGNI